MKDADSKMATEVDDLLAKVKAGEEVKLVTGLPQVSVTHKLLRK